MAFPRFRAAPIAPLLLALLVGACGWAKAPTNETGGGSTAATTSFAGQLQPGLYATVQTGDVEYTDKECITAEQLAKGQLAPDKSLKEGWHFVRNSMSGGRFAFEAAGPDNARIVSDGTYTATSYEGDFAMHYRQDGKLQATRFKMKGTRIADDCKGEE